MRKRIRSQSDVELQRVAHYRTRYAVLKGEIQKEPCKICGDDKRVEAHHEDYSKPLEIVWLCPKHHRRRDAEIARNFPKIPYNTQKLKFTGCKRRIVYFEGKHLRALLKTRREQGCSLSFALSQYLDKAINHTKEQDKKPHERRIR